MASIGDVLSLDAQRQSRFGVGKAADWSSDWPKTTVPGPVSEFGVPFHGQK